MPSRRLWRLSLLVLGVAAVLAALVAVLHAAPVQRKLGKALASRLDTALAADVELGDLRFDLFSGKVSVERLELRGRGPRAGTLISVPHARLRLSPGELLRGRIRVEELQLERPGARLALDADGRLVLPFQVAPSKKDRSSSPPDIVFRNVRCTAGWIDLQDRGPLARRVESQEISFSGGLALRTATSRGTLSLGGLHVSGAGKAPLAGTTLSLSWDLRDGSGPVRGEAAASELGIALALTGTLHEMGSAGRYTAVLTLEGDMAPLAARLAPALGLAGDVHAEIEASGDLASLPDVHAVARVRDLHAAGRSLERVELRAELRGGRLLSAVVDAEDAAGSGHVEAEGARLPSLEGLSFRGHVERVDVERFLARTTPGPRLASTLDADFEGALREASLAGTSLSVTGTLVPAGSTSRQTLAPAARAQLRLADGVLTVEELSFEDGTTSGSLSGSYRHASRSFEGRLELEAPQIGPYLALAGIEGRGELHAEIQGSGTLDRPALDGTVRGRALTFSGIRVDRMELDASLEGRRFSLSRGSFTGSGLEAEAEGEGTLPGARGETPEVTARLRGIRFRGHALPDLDAHAIVGPTVEVTAAATDGSLRASGREDAAGDREARIMFERFDLGRIAAFLPERFADLTGAVSGHLEASLGKDRPPDVRVALASLRAATSGHVITATDLEGRLRDSAVEIARCRVDADEGSHIALSGKAALDGSALDLRVVAEVPDLCAWSELVPGASKPGGRLSADVVVSGSLRRPKASGAVRARDLTVEGALVERVDLTFDPGPGADLSARLDLDGIHSAAYQLGRVQLAARRDGDKVTITGSTLDGQIALRGDLSLAEPWPASFDAELKALPVERLLSIARQSGHGLKGLLSGRVRGRGELNDLAGLRVEAELSQIQLASGELEARADRPARFGAGNGWLEVQALHLVANGASLDVSGGLPFEGTSTRSLSVTAEAALHDLLPLAPALDRARGTIAARLDVSGSLRQPRITGKVTLADALLDGPDFPSPIEKMSGSLSLSPEVIRLEALSARVAEGSVALSGELGLRGVTPGDLRASLRVRDIDMEVIRDLQVKGSADLTAGGTWPDLRVEGEIRVDDAAYIPSLDLSGLLRSFAASRTVRARERAKKPAGPRVALDLAVVAKDSIHIEGNLGEAELGGTLQIKGTADKPIVLGTISSNRGTFNLLGSSYELNRARVTFDDPVTVDPDLDISGTTTSAEDEVTIQIRGKASKAQLTLSSSSGRSQADILASLTGGSASGATLSDTATKMALRGATAPLLGALGGSADLEIEPLPTTSEGEDFLFSVSKPFSEGITATYFKGGGGDSSDAFELRWRISSRARGRLRQNQDGTLSGGFRLRREFN